VLLVGCQIIFEAFAQLSQANRVQDIYLFSFEVVSEVPQNPRVVLWLLAASIPQKVFNLTE
jgi:hypothetical protein